MNRRQAQAGFTVVEVGISGFIFGLIVLLGLEVSRSTIDSTFTSVRRSEQTQVVARSLDSIGLPLSAAGVSTLIATPAGKNAVPEPMQDGTVYDNVAFQKAIGFANGLVVYDATGPGGPQQIQYVPFDPKQPDTTGLVTWFDGQRAHVIQRAVAGFQVVKKGSQLVFSVTPYDKQQQGNGPTLVHRVLLRAP